MVYPNPQIYHHLRTIFVHVPKTGGTSVEKMLRRHKTDVVGGHTTALGYQKAFPDLFAVYYKFAIVRHPLDRFLSAYNYLAQSPVHGALNNDVIHKSGSLAGFVSLVAREPEVIRKITHLLPQHQFVCDSNGKVLVDAVYKFEALSDAWRSICKRLGIQPVALPRLNQSRHACDAMCHGEALKDLVRELYARDSEIFDYP